MVELFPYSYQSESDDESELTSQPAKQKSVEDDSGDEMPAQGKQKKG